MYPCVRECDVAISFPVSHRTHDVDVCVDIGSILQFQFQEDVTSDFRTVSESITSEKRETLSLTPPTTPLRPTIRAHTLQHAQDFLPFLRSKLILLSDPLKLFAHAILYIIYIVEQGQPDLYTLTWKRDTDRGVVC
ncbi:hypothetical protein CBL_13786 [Carabus blaptoides fortunei]